MTTTMRDIVITEHCTAITAARRVVPRSTIAFIDHEQNSYGEGSFLCRCSAHARRGAASDRGESAWSVLVACIDAVFHAVQSTGSW